MTGCTRRLTATKAYDAGSANEHAQPKYCWALMNGGAEEDRTPDLRIANATLSQLSYRPNEEGR